jgi:hypothetical protein
MQNVFSNLIQPLFNKEVDYCICDVIHSHLDTVLVVTKQLCPVCKKRIKKEFMDSKFGLVVISGKETLSVKRPDKKKYIEAILLDGINKVKVSILDRELNVNTKCLNTKNLKLRFLIKYDGIKYMDTEGFSYHNQNFRPFKPGKVKGYINSHNEFVIIKNI